MTSREDRTAARCVGFVPRLHDTRGRVRRGMPRFPRSVRRRCLRRCGTRGCSPADPERRAPFLSRRNREAVQRHRALGRTAVAALASRERPAVSRVAALGRRFLGSPGTLGCLRRRVAFSASHGLRFPTFPARPALTSCDGRLALPTVVAHEDRRWRDDPERKQLWWQH